MQQVKDNSERILIIALVLAVAVPWASLVIAKDGLKALFVLVPVIIIFFFMGDLLPNYLFYRRCKRFVGERGGTIVSHNFNYSELIVNAGGLKTEISVARGFRMPTYVSLSTTLDRNHSYKFWMTPNDCFNKTVRAFEKKLDIVPDNNLVVDNKFSIAENTINVKAIETLLSPVKHDLLESLKASPTINLDGEALVLTVKDYFPDNLRLARYFRIIWSIIARLQPAKNEGET